MSLLMAYADARHDEEVARLRRVVVLRALRATGVSQSRIAAALGVSQPAVSQQLRSSASIAHAHPELLLEAAAPVIRRLAQERGYARPAVFGSVARGEARPDSDVDLLVEPPAGASSFDLVDLARLLGEVLGRDVDLVTYASLRPTIDDDILRDAVAL